MALSLQLQFTTPFASIRPGRKLQASLFLTNTGTTDVTVLDTDLNVPLATSMTVSPYVQVTATAAAHSRTYLGCWNVVFFGPGTDSPNPCTVDISASIITATTTADSVTQTLTLSTSAAESPAPAGSLDFSSPLCSAYSPFF